MVPLSWPIATAVRHDAAECRYQGANIMPAIPRASAVASNGCRRCVLNETKLAHARCAKGTNSIYGNVNRPAAILSPYNAAHDTDAGRSSTRRNATVAQMLR